MTIKRVPILCLTLSLILLTAALTHIFFPQLNNWKLLLAGERNTYTLCQPLKSTEEMRSDFREKTDIHFASIKGPEVITPTKDIHYYSAPDGITPVYTLEAGHTYAIWYSEGYGFVTWPTYSRDWRYGQPFLEVDGEGYLNAAIPEEYIDSDKLSVLPDGYIRLSDLQGLLSGKDAVLELDERYPELRLQLYDLDELMYTSNYYYSPNLPMVLDIWNVSFLAAGLLLLGLTILWMRRGLKKVAAPEEPQKEAAAEETI